MFVCAHTHTNTQPLKVLGHLKQGPYVSTELQSL